MRENPGDVGIRVSLANVLGALASLDSRNRDVDAALSKLRQSINVLEEDRGAPGHREVDLSLAAAHLQVGRVLVSERSRLPEAQSAAEAALRITQPLVRANPDDLKLRSQLSEINDTLADIENARGDYEKAFELRGQRLNFLEEISRQRPTDNGWKHTRLKAMLDVALAESRLGSNAQALARLQKARDLGVDLVHDNPTNHAYKATLADAWSRMAFPLNSLGRPADALSAVQNNAALLEELARDAPDDVELLRRLAGAYYNCALLNKGLNRVDASTADYRRSLDLRERLVRAHPEDPSLALDVASTLVNIGAGHADRNQWPAALPLFQRASAMLRTIVAAHRGNAEYESYFLRARGNEADALAQTGKSAEALEILRVDVDSRERLAREHPGFFQYQLDAASGLHSFGLALRKVGKLDDAAASFQKGIDLRERLRASHPNDPENLDHLVSLYESQAALEKERNRPREAAQPYRTAFKMLDRIQAASTEQCYNLCCYQARLATAASTSGSGMTADELRPEFDKAMATLTRAVAGGFHDADQLRNDADLEGLRQREDFKQLLARLATGKQPATKP